MVDLRLKFGMQEQETTDKTCVIVVQVKQGDKRIIMGTVVDEVSEVLDITAGQIEPAPEFGGGSETAFIMGVGKVGTKVIMLLEVDLMLADSLMKV